MTELFGILGLLVFFSFTEALDVRSLACTIRKCNQCSSVFLQNIGNLKQQQFCKVKASIGAILSFSYDRVKKSFTKNYQRIDIRRCNLLGLGLESCGFNCFGHPRCIMYGQLYLIPFKAFIFTPCCQSLKSYIDRRLF